MNFPVILLRVKLCNPLQGVINHETIKIPFRVEKDHRKHAFLSAGAIRNEPEVYVHKTYPKKNIANCYLEVVERRNHMFTVGYVPYGRDATVSYGEVDFRFRNNTRWPIQIKAWVANKQVFFCALGTNQDPGKKVEMVQKIIKTTPNQIVYKYDPNLLIGQSSVKQSGSSGYVVDTFKAIPAGWSDHQQCKASYQYIQAIG